MTNALLLYENREMTDSEIREMLAHDAKARRAGALAWKLIITGRMTLMEAKAYAECMRRSSVPLLDGYE